MGNYGLEGVGDGLQDVMDRLDGSIPRPSLGGLLQLMNAASERDRLIEEELKKMLQEGSGGQA